MVLRSLIGAALAILALAPPASAGTVAAVNNDPFPSAIYYSGNGTGAGAADQLTVDPDGAYWSFSVIYPTTIQPSAGDHSGACRVVQTLITVECKSIVGPLGKITYDMDVGNDTVLLKYGAGPTVTFMGGDGDDTLNTTGATSAITATGDAGNDRLLGNSAQKDTLSGGGDDDTFGALRGPDVVDGGDGNDTLDFESDQPLSISLDDHDNDGVQDQRADVIDVENALGGSMNDELLGNDEPNMLDGRAGNDHIIGLGGADTLIGNAGDDRIEARDGVADAVDCGLGNDIVVADVVDHTSACETIELPDGDGDGVSATTDCDDTRADIHPGAADTPDDGIDQNCDGADAHVIPAPPAPSVAIAAAAFGSPRWSLSRLRDDLTFALDASHAAQVTLRLMQGTSARWTKILALPAGHSQRRFSVPKTLPPGSYVLKLSGTAGGATVSSERALTLTAPPEGVVTRAVMSTRRNGPGVAEISKAKRLWAMFRFAPQGLPKKKIKAHWSRNGKKVDAFTALAPNAYSYYANPHGLKRGLWTCELRMGKTVIARVRTRIG